MFDLVRDEIPHPSIDIKFEIQPSNTGFVLCVVFPRSLRCLLLRMEPARRAVSGRRFDLDVPGPDRAVFRHGGDQRLAQGITAHPAVRWRRAHIERGHVHGDPGGHVELHGLG